ncbi:MAG: hypothetical protein ACOY9Y_07635 [Bacillota bacterium]
MINQRLWFLIPFILLFNLLSLSGTAIASWANISIEDHIKRADIIVIAKVGEVINERPY